MKEVNYKKLTGMESASDEHEVLLGNKSMKGVRGKKLVKSLKSHGKSVCSQKSKNPGGKGSSSASGDSRAHDFDSEGSSEVDTDGARLQKLEQHIEDTEPTLAEHYNQYKVDHGLQDRLEDSELPTNLEKENVFQEL